MHHPTPYYWTADDDQTHVFYDNHQHPNAEYGWSSLCDAVHLPLEGEHFELTTDATAVDITCSRCQDRLGRQADDDTLAALDGCAVWLERDETGTIVQAAQVCGTLLHHEVPFEPPSFTGDLRTQVEDVCEACWETYVDHQWTEDDQGAQLRVEAWVDDSEQTYFAERAVSERRSEGAVLRLVSKNDLEAEIHDGKIFSIDLTPAQDIVY